MRRRELLSLIPASMAVAAIPDKTIVLTLDDAVKSHRTFVGPLLKELGFSATFFVTHRWMNDRENFMSWADIAALHSMGFEIGNHSWTHSDFSVPRNVSRLAGELALVDYELNRVKVPKPVSFAWCGNTFGPEGVKLIRELGYRFARRGGAPEVEYGKIVVGPVLDTAKHHPLLIPTTGDGYPDWTFEHFLNVIAQARNGKIAVLQFHGVPDVAHPWVHTPPEAFRRYMLHLKQEGYRVLALRDLAAYYDPAHPPADPLLETRYRAPKNGVLTLPVEMEATRKDLTYWHGVMAEHSFTADEATLVTGVKESISPAPEQGLRLRPYPGGRHIRIGFLEGAVDPQRGTKASVFLPWKDAGYVVIDVPEAIIVNGKIIFLAHSHIPTIWDEQNVAIPNRDWIREPDSSLRSEWTLPNQVAFGANVKLADTAVEMELWVRNGSAEALKAMRSQVCVLFRAANGFAAQTNSNKILGRTKASVQSADGKRWIATEWEGAGRVWGNERCPCMHSDPVFPDCAPGETVRRKGRLWFGEGKQLAG